MTSKAVVLLGAAVLGLAGCASDGDIDSVSSATEARAEARDAGGTIMAQATATASGDGVRLAVEARGLAPGSYAAHIHTTGRCDAPGFESAGPHWNPLNREHGTLNPAGPHMGDLPNLLVGEDGQGSFEATVPGRLSGGSWGMLDEDGAALVIHARPDDYRTDPSGNSGTRIACGVFG